MRFLFILMLSATIQPLFAQLVPANNEVFRCPEHPVRQWHSAENLSSRLLKAGYQIDHIQTTSGGCYEVKGRTPNGQIVQLQIDPLTLRPLKTDLISFK